jgi:hypothetical protein
VVNLNNLAYLTGNKTTIEVEGTERITPAMEGLTCFICGERTSLRSGLELTRLNCQHLFHKRCILDHFRYTDTCPTPACTEEIYNLKNFKP